MSAVLDIGIWVGLWIITFGVFALLRKKGMTYNKKYGWTILYFLSFSIVGGLFFRDILVEITAEFTIIPFIILFFVYIFTVIAYFLSHKHLKKPTKSMEKYHDQHFIKMDYKYLASKSFDIFFQQVMILILILWLSKETFSMIEIIVYFVLLFGIVHLIGIITAGKVFGTYYLVMSLIGAVIFPILILNVNYGFVYSYIIHVSFYSISSIVFWLYGEKLLKAS